MKGPVQKIKNNRKMTSFINLPWWVYLTVVVSGLYQVYAAKNHSIFQKGLQNKLTELEEQRVASVQKQEDLRLQIQSQDDPAWVEMVLMRELGLVPDRTRKVFFTEE
jgi:hypothetical protein